MSEDHTKIDINWPQTNVREEVDPMIQRFDGVATHGMTPFDVPFISHIEGNLYQGGASPHLQLPHFFKHYISVAPWYNYKINHEIKSNLSVIMYDSLEQSLEQVDSLAQWINTCVKDGPTLVHCQAGLNRSGLVAGRALMLQGKTADEAIKLLRETRSPAVLCNPAFEEHLRSLDD